MTANLAQGKSARASSSQLFHPASRAVVSVSSVLTRLNGRDPKNPRLIKTIYGAGYIFLGDVDWT